MNNFDSVIIVKPTLNDEEIKRNRRKDIKFNKRKRRIRKSREYR